MWKNWFASAERFGKASEDAEECGSMTRQGEQKGNRMDRNECERLRYKDQSLVVWRPGQGCGFGRGGNSGVDDKCGRGH